ncbi:MAG: Hsp33 family molecular chaperone HslO [Polyangiaceae bacterium]|jgi:molecular chaperone Hsp33|nr:Hsp33 family molecular chaperone HslO [Polyangiaceae bacterium]MBK8940721.1 Hsp33 family molecular chaperone HslO [Polyangiaceae bacterium]
MTESDQVVRVMTNDHSFRVIVACMTGSAREVLARQGVRGLAAKALAELVTGTTLVRETMSPDLRVQGLIRGAGGKGTLVGDSFPDGSVRGLAQLRADPSAFSLGKGSHLQVMRSLINGGLQQGIVDVGEAGGIGEAITQVFAESEQIAAVAKIGARFEQGELVACGGFVVQLLPEAERATHAIMTQRLEDFPPIDAFLEQDTFGAQLLIDELVFGMPFTELGRSSLRFHCRCDESLVLSALSSLGRDDIQSMIDEGEGLDIHCDYCGKDYLIAVERLRALLEAS